MCKSKRSQEPKLAIDADTFISILEEAEISSRPKKVKTPENYEFQVQCGIGAVLTEIRDALQERNVLLNFYAKQDDENRQKSRDHTDKMLDKLIVTIHRIQEGTLSELDVVKDLAESESD